MIEFEINATISITIESDSTVDTVDKVIIVHPKYKKSLGISVFISRVTHSEFETTSLVTGSTYESIASGELLRGNR